MMEATAKIMREDGYAAATSRRVAAEAGVRPALLYYYFPTMEDLFLAVLYALAGRELARRRTVLTAEDPLQALWSISTDFQSVRLNTEFMALARYRKAIGAEFEVYIERTRDLEAAAVTLVLRTHGIDPDEFPPRALSMLISAAARMVSDESAVGVEQGHDELRGFVQRQLERFAGPPSVRPAGGTWPRSGAGR
ncbi:TetR/AcrR family transcriptional regulator [Nocardia jiangxiensis]|uniref:TetR/AcrR family transcriptional regulator n=1 Tax=Nocardia jiangxiensis TaxID=282685 RepID=UPI0009FFF0A2